MPMGFVGGSVRELLVYICMPEIGLGSSMKMPEGMSLTKVFYKHLEDLEECLFIMTQTT